MAPITPSLQVHQPRCALCNAPEMIQSGRMRTYMDAALCGSSSFCEPLSNPQENPEYTPCTISQSRHPFAPPRRSSLSPVYRSILSTVPGSIFPTLGGPLRSTCLSKPRRTAPRLNIRTHSSWLVGDRRVVSRQPANLPSRGNCPLRAVLP